MALNASDFFLPNGDLAESMFPETDEPGAWVEQWLTQAQGKTSALSTDVAEEAQAAYVYHRAYSRIANRMSAEPAEVDVDDEGAVRYTNEQRARFASLAEHYENEYDRLTGEPEGQQRRSTTTQSTSSWL